METDVNKITKQPSYRFAGYTEAWEQRKLGEVGTTYTGLSGKTKEDFGHGNGKFVTYMNVFSNAVGVLDMTEAVEIDNSQNKVLFGDVLFTTSSETPEEVGMSSVWLGNAENTYLNSFCFGYRPIVEFNPYYLAYMLRSSTMRKKITFLAQGISRYNISKNKMMEIEIPIPSMAEQKRIGEYFRNLDNLITLHQRKLEVLKEQKKTYLKLLFPAKGQTKPALRFAGFEDEWTSALLGDISELYQPKTISSEELLTEGFPVFGANGYIGYYKDYNHKEDQVTISARGEGTGTPSFVEGPVWITGNSMVVNVEKQANIIKLFLYAFCLSFNFKPFVTGGAQPQLTREVLKK